MQYCYRADELDVLLKVHYESAIVCAELLTQWSAILRGRIRTQALIIAGVSHPSKIDQLAVLKRCECLYIGSRGYEGLQSPITR